MKNKTAVCVIHTEEMYGAEIGSPLFPILRINR